MLIKKIKVSNFKSFKEQEIEFSDLNVIVGANGSGKSNFINIFKFLKSIYNNDLQDAVSDNGNEFIKNLHAKINEKVKIVIEFTPNKINEISRDETAIISRMSKINYELILNYTSNNFEIFKEKLSVKMLFEEAEILEDNSYGKTEKFAEPFSYGLTHKKGLNKKSIVEKFQSKTKNLKTNDYNLNFSVTNPFPDHLLNKLSCSNSILHTFNDYIPKIIFDIPIYDFDTKLFKNNILTLKGRKLDENGENLTGIIKQIIANGEKQKLINFFKYLLDFVEDIKVNDLTKNHGFFELTEENLPKPIPSYLLSDGTISVVALIVALYFETSDIIILEEPDNGIHPGILPKLVELMYEICPKRQIILTTHNPLIVKQLDIPKRLKNLLLIYSEDGMSEISRPATSDNVKVFLSEKIGIENLFIENLLDA